MIRNYMAIIYLGDNKQNISPLTKVRSLASIPVGGSYRIIDFALSNVLESKNKENKILKDWILENNFYCNYLEKDYSNSNYQRKAKNSISVEVLVTNYNTDEM